MMTEKLKQRYDALAIAMASLNGEAGGFSAEEVHKAKETINQILVETLAEIEKA